MTHTQRARASMTSLHITPRVVPMRHGVLTLPRRNRGRKTQEKGNLKRRKGMVVEPKKPLDVQLVAGSTNLRGRSTCASKLCCTRVASTRRDTRSLSNVYACRCLLLRYFFDPRPSGLLCVWRHTKGGQCVRCS